MFHRSERLFLRPAWPEDWEAIYSGIADERIVRNLAAAPWPYTPQDAQYFANLPHDPSNPRFMITALHGGAVTLIGCIGLDECNGQLEMGYWIGRKFWGHGYATEAGKAAVEIARMLGHGRLSASHFVDNPASGRVLRKIGFRPTGMTRKHNCLARGESVDAVGYEIDLAAAHYPPQQAA